MTPRIKLALPLLAAGLLSACDSSKTPGAGTGGANGSYRKAQVPQDPYPSCTLTQTAFNQWFASGAATENGLVNPANSVAFPHNNNCDFYQWSEQMFLWVTSPSSGAYGSRGTVMESPVFYDVSPEDSNYQRTLVPHGNGHIPNMGSHLLKNGPNRLPMIRDVSGRLFEVERPEKPAVGHLGLVQDASGSQVEVHRIGAGANGAHTLFNKAGGAIQAPKAIIRHKVHPERIVQAIGNGSERILIDRDGNEIQTEEGQATGDVLMAGNGSLVYYLVSVNDVYAYFLTAVKNGQMSGAKFPTDSAARDSICAYARQNNAVLPDSNALAIELKTSWVEAANLPNVSEYITMDAMIPTFDTSNPQQWVPTGQRRAKMALIGMHVVGSVAGHPEMIWATFEHQSNAPDSTYQYRNTAGNVVTVPADTGLGWLLANNPNSTGHNVSYMISNTVDPNAPFAVQSTGDTVIAKPGKTIQPSNTLRILPWGSAPGTQPNQQDSTAADANSEVIAINNAVRGMLLGTDKRKNYILRGATWTQGGVPPNGSSYTSSNTTPGVSIGTSSMANSTMETYFQGSGNSCFSCHSGGSSNLPDTLSHIFITTRPLFQTSARLKKQP